MFGSAALADNVLALAAVPVRFVLAGIALFAQEIVAFAFGLVVHACIGVPEQFVIVVAFQLRAACACVEAAGLADVVFTLKAVPSGFRIRGVAVIAKNPETIAFSVIGIRSGY